MYSVSLIKMVEEFDLMPIIPEMDIRGKVLERSEVNRPALQITGFFEHFDSDRVQVLGRVEYSYLEHLPEARRRDILKKIFEYNIPCLVLCKSLKPFPEFYEYSKEYDVPVFCTTLGTSDFMGEIIRWLKNELAERVTLHGVLVDVYGEGIFITGESGIGKSETALELIKRGHRLVADDAVIVKRISHSILVGTSPELIRYFLELRGIGIIDVRELFGVGSVKQTQNIDLVMNLEIWDEKKDYDRIGLNEEYVEILGNKVICNRVPILPGRNLAIICESAAINCRQRKLGFNSSVKVLEERMQEMKNIKNQF